MPGVNLNTAEKSQHKPHCLKSLCREFFPCQVWFAAEDPSTEQKLDVKNTFGPFGPVAIIGKLFTCGFTVFTQVFAWIKTDNLWFYYSYYTSWALGFATLYTLFSLSNSIVPVKQPTDGCVRGRGKVTWVLFILAVFGQGLATIIYWPLVHDWDDKVEYLDVASHGLVFLAIMNDGFLISRIPLRWMHLWLDWLFIIVYLIWTAIHSFLGLGNPNEEDNDPDTNDDAIYSNLAWDEDAKKAAILSAFVVLVVAPVLFGILRSLSLWGLPFCGSDRRRYVKSDIEEGYD